jgi:glutaconyl-CoA/methylmalonyl-CoA decarboxylase subunit gamma
MKKKLRITVKGQTYDVIAEILDDDQPAAPRTASSASVAPVQSAVSATAPATAPETKTVASAASGDVPSPIAGKVVSIQKPVGSTVAEGDVIIVLEAMKMNTEVTAPASGKVTAVKVSVGDSVDEGQGLITLA